MATCRPSLSASSLTVNGTYTFSPCDLTKYDTQLKVASGGAETPVTTSWTYWVSACPSICSWLGGAPLRWACTGTDSHALAANMRAVSPADTRNRMHILRLSRKSQ